MAAISEKQGATRTNPWRQFEWDYFLSTNLTSSRLLTAWVLILLIFTAQYVAGRLQSGDSVVFTLTLITFIAWIVTLAMTVQAEVIKRHNRMTMWLKDNLYSSVTNCLISLLLAVAIISGLWGFLNYAYFNASFSLDPEINALMTGFGREGARWGAVRANFENLLVFRMKDEIWRVWYTLGLLVALVIPSIFVYRGERFKGSFVRQLLTIAWLTTPYWAFYFLRGFGEGGIDDFGMPTQPFEWLGFGYAIGLAVLIFALGYVAKQTEAQDGQIWRILTLVINVAILGILLIFGWQFINAAIGFFLSNLGQIGQYLLIFFGLIAVMFVVSTLVDWRQKGVVRERLAGVVSSSSLISIARYIILPAMILYFISNNTGSGGLYKLDMDQVWGGLLLTLIISIFSIVVSFPFGVVLALGRRSQITGIPAWFTYTAAALVTIMLLRDAPETAAAARTTIGKAIVFWPVVIPFIAYAFQNTFKGNVVAAFSTAYIEIIRGVPLITLLFMSIILFPIFLPPDLEILNTWRVMVAFAMFSAAYLAENVRGGLQAIPKGQFEAADSLGLSNFDKYRLIILPQALRIVIPAIVGQFIGLFKDTSLVYLVGLFDFLEVANKVSNQPDWLTVRTEPYIFLLVVYFIGSSIMAGYSRRLERQLAVGQT